jgi:hypothetical protein
VREIRTLRSMSGDGKQGGAEWPKPLRPSSTLRARRRSVVTKAALSDPAGRNVSEASAGLESDDADADPPNYHGLLPGSYGVEIG